MSIARTLGCTGNTKSRTTNGVGGCEWTTNVMTSMVTLESMDGRCSQTFPLSFAEKPCGNLKFVDWGIYLDNHPQFKEIKPFLPKPGEDDSVLMILGTDHPDLILKPDDSLPGPSWIGGEGYCKPFALRTILGWSVCGYTGANSPNSVEVVNGKIVLSHFSVAFVDQAEQESTLRVQTGQPEQQHKTELVQAEQESTLWVRTGSPEQQRETELVQAEQESTLRVLTGQPEQQRETDLPPMVHPGHFHNSLDDLENTVEVHAHLQDRVLDTGQLHVSLVSTEQSDLSETDPRNSSDLIDAEMSSLLEWSLPALKSSDVKKVLWTEYREELRKRPKWNTCSGIDPKVGDFELVLDKMTEDRLYWPKAVVLGTEKALMELLRTSASDSKIGNNVAAFISLPHAQDFSELVTSRSN